MKKMLCMLMAFVLMFGVFALPASAEEAAEPAGKIYKLPGGYVDFIGMGGGRIVCGKSMGTDAEGYPIIKYGAIDKTGKILVPFEYDVATVPNEQGEFAVTKIHSDDSSASLADAIDAYLICKDLSRIDLTAIYRNDHQVYSELEVVTGEMLDNDYILLVYYSESVSNDFIVAIWNVDTKSQLWNAYVYLDEEAPDLGVPSCLVGSDRSYRCRNGTISYSTHDLTETWEIHSSYDTGRYGVLISVEEDCLYYYTYDKTTLDNFELYRYDVNTMKSENLFDKFDIDSDKVSAVVCSTLTGGRMIDEGKFFLGSADNGYTYIDYYNDVNTGFVFEYVSDNFSDGYFAAVKDGKCTYYKTDGTATEQYYVRNINFSNGVSFVTDENGDTYAINTDFERVSDNTVGLGDEGLLYAFKDQVLVTYTDQFELYVYSEDPNYAFFGDVSLDENVDVADIMLLKKHIMEDTQTEEVLAVADLDDSGSADVADIMLLKNIIMTS